MHSSLQQAMAPLGGVFASSAKSLRLSVPIAFHAESDGSSFPLDPVLRAKPGLPLKAYEQSKQELPRRRCACGDTDER